MTQEIKNDSGQLQIVLKTGFLWPTVLPETVMKRKDNVPRHAKSQKRFPSC